MKPNQAAIDLIKHFEGCRLKAYPDPVSHGDPWTVGYGSTGPNINKNTVWTQAQADADLEQRVNALVIGIGRLLHISLTDNQYTAIISLVYNIGLTAFTTSTMLKLINAGAIQQAAEQFHCWDHVDGKEDKGLLNRRLAEKKLYLS